MVFVGDGDEVFIVNSTAAWGAIVPVVSSAAAVVITIVFIVVSACAAGDCVAPAVVDLIGRIVEIEEFMFSKKLIPQVIRLMQHNLKVTVPVSVK